MVSLGRTHTHTETYLVTVALLMFPDQQPLGIARLPGEKDLAAVIPRSVVPWGVGPLQILNQCVMMPWSHLTRG